MEMWNQYDEETGCELFHLKFTDEELMDSGSPLLNDPKFREGKVARGADVSYGAFLLHNLALAVLAKEGERSMKENPK